MHNIYSSICRFYTLIFSKPVFYRFNSLLIVLGLHGIGIDNYQNHQVSGEKYVIDKYIRNLKNPIILDIGAHIGDSAILFKSVNPSAVIYSFEPNPFTFKILRKNSRKYHFQAYQAAVGEKSGLMTLYDTANGVSSPFASLYKSVVESVHHVGVNEFKVQVITMDDFYDSKLKGKMIDLLKIDVEGYEMNVLKGAKKLIKSGKVKLIQFEFNIMNRHSRIFFLDFELLLKEYRLFRLLPHGLLPINSDSLLHSEIFMYQNILAIHK